MRSGPSGGTEQMTSARILASTTAKERNSRVQAGLAEKMPNSMGFWPISFMENSPSPHFL